MNSSYVVGIDVGGQTSKIGVVDARGTVLAQTVIRTDTYSDVAPYIVELAEAVRKVIKEAGAEVTVIVGFRSKDIVILEEEFKACADRLILMTDDGSYGRHGLVTQPLKEMLEAGEEFDEVLAIGPIPMMKFVSLTTKPFGTHTSVSLNPIMVDGTGMCGGCRVTVGGETKFACVDGPDFNGYEVDFDEAMMRSRMYAPFERHAHEKTCNLYRKEVR